MKLTTSKEFTAELELLLNKVSMTEALTADDKYEKAKLSALENTIQEALQSSNDLIWILEDAEEGKEVSDYSKQRYTNITNYHFPK